MATGLSMMNRTVYQVFVVLRFYSIGKEIFLPSPNSNILKRVDS